MFKEYKLLKLSFGLILLVFVLFQWNKGIENSVNLFTNKISYTSSEEIKIISTETADIQVGNLSGDVLYQGMSDDVISPLAKGIYVVNNQSPLVVKGAEKEDVTVVFPYVNNLLFNKRKGKAYIANPIDTFSLDSPSYVDELDLNLFRLVEELNLDYNVITDYDLEKDEVWKNSKCVIVYGKSKFYSSGMNKALFDYMKGGGNVLLISSSFSFYQVSINEDSRTIIKVKDSLDAFVRHREKIPVYEAYGGIANTNSLTFENDTEDINIVSSYWSNFFNRENKFVFAAKAKLKIKSEKNEYARIGEIRLEREESGVTYLIGSEDVLLNINMQNEEWKNFLSSVILKLIEQ
jgi:hypothetical protein